MRRIREISVFIYFVTFLKLAKYMQGLILRYCKCCVHKRMIASLLFGLLRELQNIRITKPNQKLLPNVKTMVPP